jgi:hypothetical protein
VHGVLAFFDINPTVSSIPFQKKKKKKKNHDSTLNFYVAELSLQKSVYGSARGNVVFSYATKLCLISFSTETLE